MPFVFISEIGNCKAARKIENIAEGLVCKSSNPLKFHVYYGRLVVILR